MNYDGKSIKYIVCIFLAVIAFILYGWHTSEKNGCPCLRT